MSLSYSDTPEPDETVELRGDEEEWDCGSGECDPNVGCPHCNDEDRTWTRVAR